MEKALQDVIQQQRLSRLNEKKAQARKLNHGGWRQPRPRSAPNVLREWLEREPRPMSKLRFAELIGVTPSYVSMLLADGAPWPGREIARRIGEATAGDVTPNDLAGYPPGA